MATSVHGLGKEILDKMEEAGIMPAGCTRIIIDIPLDGMIQVYTTTYMEKKAIDIVCAVILEVKKDEPESEAGNESP